MIKPVNAIIVEDAPIAEEHLKKLLADYCPHINVIASYSSAREAIKHLPGLNYDLLFLDVEFNDGYNAFRMLEDLEFTETQIIFTTAFEKYRKDAADVNSIKYLLKPIKKEELITAVERSEQILVGKNKLYDIEKHHKAITTGKLVVNTDGISYFIHPDEIVYMEAAGAYTKIYFYSEDRVNEVLSTHNLGKYMQILVGQNFLRVHKKYMVNIDYAKSCQRNTLKLSADHQIIEVSISKNRRHKIIEAISLKNLKL